ncbi:MAG: hypothetical protein RAP70_00110 [Candidatus Celaenobacter antarcticus]|nr:hypothetical protein [Candidatus Celaenobacter antarcticus]
MKYILRLFVCVVIFCITSCMVNSPTPSIYAVSPADSSIFYLDTLAVIEFHLPDFEQEIQLQISEESSFLIILYDNVFHDENFHYLPMSFFKENAKYFWRIRGRNPDNDISILAFFHYLWSEWSEYWCFFVR